MPFDFSSSLVGLSLLSGENAFLTAGSAATVESRAVRVAKAQFTTPATTPPWKEAATSQPFSAQVSAVKALRSIIDRNSTGIGLLPPDVQTSFTVYKALDRLRLLAESAASKNTSDAQRKSLQPAFAKGLDDLRDYLAQAPGNLLDIAFGQPSRYAKSIGVNTPDAFKVTGKGLVTQRTDAIPGLTGQEQIQITLKKPGATDVVTVDLAQGPQPPTIDSVTAALNAAITAIPLRNADGTVRTNENGDPEPRWLVRFVPDRGTDKWGFALNAPSGVEEVTLDQTNAADAIVVATGQTALDSPTATQLFRLDDPAGAATRKVLTTISALDRIASAQALLAGKTTSTTTSFKTDAFGVQTAQTAKSWTVQANTDAAAIASDGAGNSYVVGTTQGDLGAARSSGSDTLFLTKLDGEGKVVWQRALGSAGSASGAAVSVTATGDVVVAGSVNGSFDDAQTDGDMVVARYSANGDESFATVIRSVGADTARAVAVGADGSIFVGGRAATGGGDAFIARIDTTGHVVERRTIDGGGSDSVTALAIAADGSLLALVNRDGTASVRKFDPAALTTETGSVDLGQVDARAIAVDASGAIAVVGARSGGSDGRDGFVARIDAGLGSAQFTALATAGDDQADSVAFMDGAIYVGGRTTGALGAERRGPTDGFVARVDAATGAVASVTQFGQSLLRTEPVRITATPRGATSLGALGFARGTINPAYSERLTTQTALRPGDQFSIRVDNGTLRKVTIAASDTMKTLMERVAVITGSKASVSAPRIKGEQSLRIDAKAGHTIQLVAGPDGRDALDKLGIDPQQIETPIARDPKGPKVRPGGSFGLALGEGLNLLTQDGAVATLAKIKSAISISQSAYRSLYWDAGKAIIANGATNSATGKQSTAREESQLANYRAALERLTPSTSSGFGF